MKTTNIKTYSELMKLCTFLERYEYLKIGGRVGEETFGFDRYLNQQFYKYDADWHRVRRDVIIRDLGCDLGIEGREIQGRIIVHHMNPISEYDLHYRTDILLNPEYLICTCKNTHDAIHYSNDTILVKDPIVRTQNDTCPWRR